MSVASSSLEHVSIRNRCKDINIDSCVANVALIDNLNAKIVFKLKMLMIN